MRIRTIKPDFWGHPVMSKQSDATKLLALGLLNLADDEGYFYADPRMVRNAIRPLDDDSGITTVSLLELSEIGYIVVRKHPTHGDIGFIQSFANHQVINKAKASKIKDFYESCIDTVSRRDEYRLERKGMEGKGMDSLCDKSHEDEKSDELATVWKTFNPKSRERSSIRQFKAEWGKVKNKPPLAELMKAIEDWNNSKEWRKDNRQYAPGAHLFIKNEKWLIKPEPYQESTTRPVTEQFTFQKNGQNLRPY